MNIKEYENRRNEILLAIIRTYILTAQPVGSQAVSKGSPLGLSSATIRHVMAQLEEEGYITHPHTSAGRIPTNKGYRFFVDHLLEQERLNEEERYEIEATYPKQEQLAEELLHKTAQLLSRLTQQVAVCISPPLASSYLKRIEMIPLESRQCVLVLVSNTGFVKNAVVQLDEEIHRDELVRLCSFLNSELAGMSLGEAMSYLYRRLLDERSSFFHICKRAQHILEQSGVMESEEAFFLEGAGTILEKPEFQSSEQALPVLKILEDKTLLLKILRHDGESEGLHIHIGEEHGLEGMRTCTLITRTYRFGQKSYGTIGVMGPTRLDYSRTISVVDSIASKLSEISEAFGL